MAKKSFDIAPVSITALDAFNSMLGGENEGERIHLISIDELTEYPNQPFKPHSKSKLDELANDIADNGVLSPLLIRKFENSYQILAGRNRKNAALLAGLDKIPCIIKDVTEEEAILIMVNTNLNQRDELLFSEKAFSYKIQLEAITRQGERTDLSLCQVGTRSAGAEVASANSESKRQIHRYIRLTYLKIEFLDMVDNKNLPFMVGVALSYLSSEQQETLWNFLDENEIQKISIKQAEQIKESSSVDEKFLKEVFGLISTPNRPVKRSWKKTTAVIEEIFGGEDMSDDEIAEIIKTALVEYQKLSY